MENLSMYLQNIGAAALTDLPLAMAYVPSQRWEEIYEDNDGFERGTIFRALDKPFLGREPGKNG